jgi:hypothetical protein
MKDEGNQWLVDEKRELISGGIWVRLAELLTVVSTFKNATEDIERDAFGTLSYVYDELILSHLVCQNINWPALAVRWPPVHAHSRVRYLGDDIEGVIVTPVHLPFGLSLRNRALLAAILNLSVNIKKSLTGWELKKASGLLERARVQVSPSSMQRSGLEISSTRAAFGGLTRRDLLTDDEESILSQVTRFRALDRRPVIAQVGFDPFGSWRANEPLFPI